MLQRVYGISFPKASDLDEYLTMIEEAKKRDHRKLAAIWSCLHPGGGAGLPVLPAEGHGAQEPAHRLLAPDHREAGYQEISTPMILNRSLWERSGHWDHYKQNMYTPSLTMKISPSADELPGAVSSSTRRSCIPTAICRCAWASSALYTVTSCPARSTG